MAVDHIRYDILAQQALRGVVRTVLADAAKNGLPGDHHFKITFATVAPGVRLSERMRAQYPEAMTIILQHQFWDLIVTDDAFEVGLSFGGIPERLAIPFDAVTAFYDPAVQFGFQFEMLEAGATGAPIAAAEAPEQSGEPRGRVAAEPIRSESGKNEPAKIGPAKIAPAKNAPAKIVPAKSEVASTESPEPAPTGGGEVVRLDRFRKK